MHSHPNQTEVITVKRGKARIIMPGKEAVLGAGETIHIPAGQLHHFLNASDEELHVQAELMELGED
jgi:quercetin dioxygenase-like cupin family protein